MDLKLRTKYKKTLSNATKAKIEKFNKSSMRAWRQKLVTNLKQLITPFVESSSTIEAMDETMVTVNRLGDVEEDCVTEVLALQMILVR